MVRSLLGTLQGVTVDRIQDGSLQGMLQGTRADWIRTGSLPRVLTRGKQRKSPYRYYREHIERKEST